MLALGGVPSLLMFVGMFFVPETPRWLIFHNRLDKAQEVLARLHPPSEKWQEYQVILADYEDHVRTKFGKG